MPIYTPPEGPGSAASVPLPAASCSGPAGPLWRRSDAQGLAVAFDAAWLAFTERSSQASLRNGWLQDVHPDDRARCVAIHTAMQEQRVAYTLDFRLRHAVRGHCWLMERATPLAGADGAFDGYAHHCTDVNDRIALEEALAERSRRMRFAMRSQSLFATALAAEVGSLPPAQVALALQAMARMSAQAPAVRRVVTPAGAWIARIAAEVDRSRGTAAPAWRLAPEAAGHDLWVDGDLLAPAVANAIASAGFLASRPARAAPPSARVEHERFVLELNALRGSSALVLLDLALRLHDCAAEPLDAHGARWRVALPTA